MALSAGGTSDIFIRALGEDASKRWGQPLIVENRPGGNTNIAGKACAEAANDGYTICILPGETLAFNRFQYKKLAYDAEKDFAPITNLFYSLSALVASTALKVKTIEDLVAVAKAKPDALLHGAVGAARAVHGAAQPGARYRHRARAVPRRRRSGERDPVGVDAGRLRRHLQFHLALAGGRSMRRWRSIM